MQTPINNRRADYLIVLLLVGLIAIAYWQVHAFGFIGFDDADNITRNGHVQTGLSIANIRWAFTTTYANFRMPIVWLSMMLDRNLASLGVAHGIHLGPDNSGVFHLTNVLLHTANTLMLFLLLFRLTGYRWRSALVAALFAIHPLHVESVAWATERKDVLSAFFCLLTLLFYAEYTRKRGIARYLLVAVTFAIGLLAKPMLVTLPALMLLMDYWPLKRLGLKAIGSGDGKLLSRRMVSLSLEKIPLFVLTGVAGVLAVAAQNGGGALPSTNMYPLGLRIANALSSYLIYAWQMIWPRGLVPFYPLDSGKIPVVTAIAGAIWLLAASFAAIKMARRRPYVLFGWLWYVISLLPVIQLIQVGNHARADRYTYLPLIGLFVAIVWLGAELFEERARAGRLRLAGVIACCAVVCVLTGLSCYQVSRWRDNTALFEHTMRYSPNNPLAYNILGVELLHKKKFDAAAEYFRKALEIWPGYAMAKGNLGTAYESMGRLDQAIDCYEATIAIMSPDQAAPYQMDLGRVLVAKGHPEQAVEHMEAGVEAVGDCPGYHNDLGSVLVMLGRDKEAESQFTEELGLNPRCFESNSNLGRLMMKQQDLEKAVGYLSDAVGLQPALIQPRLELAQVLYATGKPLEALREYREAHRRRPGNPDAANGIAWILSTSPDASVRNGAEAVALSELACRSTKYRDPAGLDTLAAAYAEAGRFEDAARTASNAAAIAESQKDHPLAAQIQGRAAMYRAHRPYREAVR